jgi:hypothetical protein
LSAFSFPGTASWAGHQRASIWISGRLSCSATIYFLARMACICPGPDSSEPRQLMAAWASMNIVAPSGVMRRLAATSRTWRVPQILHRRPLG